MDEESILFVGEADFSGALDELDAFDEAVASSAESLAALGASADDLTSLDDAFASLTEMIGQVEDLLSSLTENLDSAAVSAGAAASAFDEIGAAAASLEELTVAAEEATGALEGMGTAGEEAGAETEAAFGGGATMGATLLAGAVVMAGKSFLDMGSQAEDSLAQVEGMAGVTKEQMDQMLPTLESQAVTFGDSMKQVGDALYFVESAGYSGSGALTVEREALEASSASGADFQLVASALTGELHAYGASAKDAKQYTDNMVEGVVQGKQSFQDFASAIGPLASIGHQTGLSFQEVVAAEATMTQINPHVRQDGSQLQAVFRAVGLNADAVAKSAKGMGLSFDENSYKSMSLIQKLQYLQDISKGNKTDFEKLVGGAAGLGAAMDLLSGKGSVYAGILNKIKDSSGATDKAFASSTQTMSANANKVGAAISVLALNVTEMIAPSVSAALAGLAGALGGLTSWVESHGQVAIPILIGLAAALGGALLAAVVAIVGPLIAAVAPFLAIGAAIGLAVAGIGLLIANWQKIVGAIMSSPVGPLLRQLGGIFTELGSTVRSLFIPVFQQLQQIWQGQLMPLFRQFQPLIQQLTPLFQLLGMVLGGMVVVSLGLLIGLLTGVAKGVSYMIEGLAKAVGGLVQMFTGIVQVIAGIVQFIVDLIHGRFGKLQGDLGQIGTGIVNIFKGMWTAAVGVFQAAWGLISGIVGGFVQGVISFFTHLYHEIVGGSIIPDLVNGIVHWLESLPGKALGFIDSLVSGFIGRVGNLKDMVVARIQELVALALAVIEQWVSGWLARAESLRSQIVSKIQSMVSGLLNELRSLPAQAASIVQSMITGMVGAITNGVGQLVNAAKNAAGSVASGFKSFLHFSKPEEGPLADADTWMPDMLELFSQGISANQGKIKAALTGVGLTMQNTMQTTAPAPGLYSALAPSALPATQALGGGLGGIGGGLDNRAVVALLVQILAALVAAQGASATNVSMTNTINAPGGDAQQLFNVFQALGGYQYGQSLQRGALGL